jgi:hypothetical protein
MEQRNASSSLPTITVLTRGSTSRRKYLPPSFKIWASSPTLVLDAVPFRPPSLDHVPTDRIQANPTNYAE